MGIYTVNGVDRREDPTQWGIYCFLFMAGLAVAVCALPFFFNGRNKVAFYTALVAALIANFFGQGLYLTDADMEGVEMSDSSNQNPNQQQILGDVSSNPSALLQAERALGMI